MRRFIFAGTLALAAVFGCDPDDVPRFSPDGKSVAVFLHPEQDAKDSVVPLRLLDLDKKEWRQIAMPDRWSVNALAWAGPRLIVTADRPKAVQPTEKGEPTHDICFFLVDPATGKAEPTTLKPRIFSTPFSAPWKGKPSLFIHDPEKEATDILLLPNLAPVESLPFQVDSAGGGWLIRAVQAEKALKSVDVMDSEGKVACSIPREEIAKACHRDASSPECGRVSTDGKHVVLGFDTSTIFRQAPTEYTYGVYRLSDGTLAWKGGSNALKGLPLMIGDAVYALEAKSRAIYTGKRTVAALGEGAPARSEPTSEVVLARHTAEGRVVVLDLALQKADRAARYSASPDGKSFVLLVEGPAPQLLIVPVAEKVAAAELREYPLQLK